MKAKYTHEELVQKMLEDPETKKEYDKLEPEFKLFKEMLEARLAAGKTRDDIAKAMRTTKAAISRLEHSGGKQLHSPNIATLRKYAKAVNCDLEIKFLPMK